MGTWKRGWHVRVRQRLPDDLFLKNSNEQDLTIVVEICNVLFRFCCYNQAKRSKRKIVKIKLEKKNTKSNQTERKTKR